MPATRYRLNNLISHAVIHFWYFNAIHSLKETVWVCKIYVYFSYLHENNMKRTAGRACLDIFLQAN